MTQNNTSGKQEIPVELLLNKIGEHVHVNIDQRRAWLLSEVERKNHRLRELQQRQVQLSSRGSAQPSEPPPLPDEPLDPFGGATEVAASSHQTFGFGGDDEDELLFSSFEPTGIQPAAASVDQSFGLMDDELLGISDTSEPVLEGMEENDELFRNKSNIPLEDGTLALGVDNWGVGVGDNDAPLMLEGDDAPSLLSKEPKRDDEMFHGKSDIPSEDDTLALGVDSGGADIGGDDALPEEVNSSLGLDDILGDIARLDFGLTGEEGKE